MPSYRYTLFVFILIFTLHILIFIPVNLKISQCLVDGLMHNLETPFFILKSPLY